MNALIVPIPHRSISATSSGQMLSWWCLYSGRASASSRRVNAFRIIRLPPYWCSLYESEGRSGVAIGWNRFRQTPAWQPSGLPSLGVAASRSTRPGERAAPRGVTKHVTREAGGPLAWLRYGGGGKDRWSVQIGGSFAGHPARSPARPRSPPGFTSIRALAAIVGGTALIAACTDEG